jgi:uncharacterized protein DUF6788
MPRSRRRRCTRRCAGRPVQDRTAIRVFRTLAGRQPVRIASSSAMLLRVAFCLRALVRSPWPRPGGLPYWQWTRKLHGKTVTQRVSEEQATLLRTRLENAPRLDQLLVELDVLSTQVTDRIPATASRP